MQSPMTGNAPSPARHSAFRSRLPAALLMGAVLLALSALIHAAAAATPGGGWTSLGALWLARIVLITLVVYSVRNMLAVWRRMCLVNGIASFGDCRQQRRSRRRPISRDPLAERAGARFRRHVGAAGDRRIVSRRRILRRLASAVTI
jgi:hypothetical protein